MLDDLNFFLLFFDLYSPCCNFFKNCFYPGLCTFLYSFMDTSTVAITALKYAFNLECIVLCMLWYNIYVIKSTQKQPGCKKGATLFKMASMKKFVKSKGAAKIWLWWYRLMAKILITTIQVNLLCCFIIASQGISTKFTWIVVIKIFAINLYHHSHFLAAPFTTFSHS